MKKIICILAILSALVFLVSCNDELFDENYVYDGTSLIGIWCEKDYDESNYYTYKFFENGSIIKSAYNYGIEASSIDGHYEAVGHELTIKILLYSGVTDVQTFKFTITDKKELALVYLDENLMKEKETVLVPYESTFNKDNSSIVGVWEDTENPGEMWQFNSDFSGSVYDSENSYKMFYSLTDKKLYMAYEFVEGIRQSLVEFKYEIKGDTLHLESKINGTTIEYTFKKVQNG